MHPSASLSGGPWSDSCVYIGPDTGARTDCPRTPALFLAGVPVSKHPASKWNRQLETLILALPNFSLDFHHVFHLERENWEPSVWTTDEFCWESPIVCLPPCFAALHIIWVEKIKR